jgi:phage tail-like protein
VRGLIEGLNSPHPLGETLPAMYQQEDDFALRFTDALDEVIAPVMLALDNLDAYLDPMLAPRDFLEWMANWVGIDLDETWPEHKQREQVRSAVNLYRWRGTKKGLADVIRLYCDVEPEIIDNGGTSYSDGPTGPLPGSPTPSLHVRVTVPAGRDIDESRLHELVSAAKPGHLPHTIEVIRA